MTTKYLLHTYLKQVTQIRGWDALVSMPSSLLAFMGLHACSNILYWGRGGGRGGGEGAPNMRFVHARARARALFWLELCS